MVLCCCCCRISAYYNRNRGAHRLLLRRIMAGDSISWPKSANYQHHPDVNVFVVDRFFLVERVRARALSDARILPQEQKTIHTKIQGMLRPSCNTKNAENTKKGHYIAIHFTFSIDSRRGMNRLDSISSTLMTPYIIVALSNFLYTGAQCFNIQLRYGLRAHLPYLMHL